MELHFLGYGAAYYPEFGNNAAWFTWQGDFCLLDCGEDVFGKVCQMPEYREAKRVLVILTHMHSDHVGSLGSLISYTRHFYRKEVCVIYPDAALKKYLELIGIHGDGWRQVRGAFHENGIAIEPVPVYHDPSMGCYGYRIAAGGERLYYSGDSRVVGSWIIRSLAEGELDRIYVDTGKYAAVSSGHGNFEALKERVPVELRGKVTCMHLDCDFRQEILEAGFRVCG